MALALDTLLATPYGWTSVHDLKEGEILYDELGFPCEVTAVSDPRIPTETWDLDFGVTNRKPISGGHLVMGMTQPLLAIPTRNIEKWEDLKHITHLSKIDRYETIPEDWPTWTVKDIPREYSKHRSDKGGNPNWPVKPYAQSVTPTHIAQKLRSVRRHAAKTPAYRWTIPITFGLNAMKAGVGIPPYVLGVMIHCYNPTTKTLDIDAQSFDHYEQMFAECGVELSVDRSTLTRGHKHISAKIEPEITERWDHKHEDGALPIPEEYLRGNTDQRLHLLQGLLDQWRWNAPAKVNTATGTYYTTGNQDAQSIPQVLELVRSLGWPGVHWDHGGQHVIFYPKENLFLHPKRRRRHAIAQPVNPPNRLSRYLWKVLDATRVDDVPVRNISVDSRHGLYAAGEILLPVKSDG